MSATAPPANPFDGLALSVDGAEAPTADAGTSTPATTPAVTELAAPRPMPEDMKRAILSACGNIAVEPFTLVAFGTNNAVWLQAAERRQEQLAQCLFDLGMAAGWFSGEDSALPPWFFPSLALLAGVRGVATDALMADPVPLRRKKPAPDEKKDGGA